LPGIDIADAEEFRTPWSCSIIAKGITTSPSATEVVTTAIATTTTVSTSTSTPSELQLRGFGSHIEGASIDPAGNFYATHFRDTLDSSSKGNELGRNVIGKVDLSTGKASAFFVGEPEAVFNGMRWSASGYILFLADVGQGKVVQVDTSTMSSTDYCGSPEMRSVGVPNDLALSKNGFLYLSGQDWASSKGALWLCKPSSANSGVALLLEGGMGRTNGIALSPDDKTLYLTEANGSPVLHASFAGGQRIWKYSINSDGSVGMKTLFYDFALDPLVPEANIDSDGMRTDDHGNLYVTRNGGGKIMVFSPEGRLEKEIKLSNVVSVTNMAFGGADGSWIYAVGRCGSASWGTGDGCLDILANDHAGREWTWFRSLSMKTTTWAATTSSPLCSGFKEDCRSSKCCSNPSLTCYEKNEWWGECRQSCVPGVDVDEEEGFRTPWSCTVLTANPTMPPATTTTTSSMTISPMTTSVTTIPQATTTITPAGSPVARHGQLRVTGNKIVNQQGEPVQLRGMSFFWSQWQGRYWTEGAVRWLSNDWSVSVVRAAMGIDHGGYLSNPAKHKALAMTVVDAAIAAGIYVIIDWHDHHAEEHTAESIAFFTEMAQKYADIPNVLYETYNEPIGQSWSGVIKPYHEKVVSAIRKHSANIVILGTRFYSQEVDEASQDPVVGINLAYTIHFYAAAPAHGEGLRQKAKRALSNGVALFATEWGTCREWGGGNLDFHATQAWLDFMAMHHISDANWAISNKGESASALRSSASFTGGWGAGDLTTSGTWVRASIRAFTGAVGTGFDQDHDHGNGDGGSVNSHCAAAKEDCQNEKCCRESNMKCFKKNQWFAACLATCAPGIHSDDPVQFQTPWSCEELGR
jgi:endoglucanase